MNSTPRTFTYDRYWGIFKYQLSNSTQPVRIYAGIGIKMNNIVLGTSDPIVGYGYTGSVDYLDDPSEETLVGRGAITAGMYTFRGPHESDKMGSYIWELVPDDTNEMFGRRGFYNHGDNSLYNHTASGGCIVSPLEVRSIWRDGDRLRVF
jgi:hypothetical protein